MFIEAEPVIEISFKGSCICIDLDLQFYKNGKPGVTNRLVHIWIQRVSTVTVLVSNNKENVRIYDFFRSAKFGNRCGYKGRDPTLKGKL